MTDRRGLIAGFRQSARSNLSRQTARIRCRVDRLRFSRRVQISTFPNLRRLGTPYGGWTFAVVPELRDSVVISCGVGEDASFDVEIASEFGAQVLMVDPTPRAIQHFHEIEARIGLPAERAYADGGLQPADAYDLSRIRPGQLVLVDKAVSDAVGRVRFYAPKNPDHVSYSIVNFQHDYSSSTPFLEVDSVTMDHLIAMIDPGRLQLLKLNIEGAEIGVIQQMLGQNIRPRQMCIEFDELGIPTTRAFADFFKSHALLEAADYRLAYFNGVSGFLYLQSSLYPDR